VVVVVAWGAVVGLTLLGAYRHDRSGLAILSVVRARLTASSVTGTATSDALVAAEGQFAAARRSLGSWWMDPVTVVPVVGRQVQSVTDLSAAAATIAATGTSFVDEVHAVLDAPHAAGPERVAALRRLATAAGAAARALDRVDTGPVSGLLSPLAAKRNELVTQLDDAQGRLARAAAAAGAAATILEGPGRVSSQLSRRRPAVVSDPPLTGTAHRKKVWTFPEIDGQATTAITTPATIDPDSSHSRSQRPRTRGRTASPVLDRSPLRTPGTRHT